MTLTQWNLSSPTSTFSKPGLLSTTSGDPSFPEGFCSPGLSLGLGVGLADLNCPGLFMIFPAVFTLSKTSFKDLSPLTLINKTPLLSSSGLLEDPPLTLLYISFIGVSPGTLLT